MPLEVLRLISRFSVTSIQSFPLDGKTPTAETFSPIGEQPKIVTQVPPPKFSDFKETDTDPYSELCTQQLDSLGNLEEEPEIEFTPPTKKESTAKLQPLDLKRNEPKPQPPQKLTTPGEYICSFRPSLSADDI